MPIELSSTEVGTGRPLVILHGLFGSGRNWATIAKRLSDTHRVLALDLRNHGASPWADEMSYEAMAEDVARTLHKFGLASADVIGHSMGGRTAMTLALTRPETVDRLVVVDIPPAPSSRGHLAFVHAMRALDLSGVRRRTEVDALLSEQIPDYPTRMFLLQNLTPTSSGQLQWRINLEAIERSMDRLTGFPDLGGDVRFEGPALFVNGRNSDYVRQEHHEVIARLFPNHRMVTIEDAGHWVHAEQPERFLTAVQSFLDGSA